jgi:hypothetical protein
MSLATLADLFARSTIEEIFDLGIAVARKLDVPVDTWQTGDPTRSLYRFMAEYLDSFEGIAQNYVASAFLGLVRPLAEQLPGAYPWLVRLAYEQYGYVADEATFASVQMKLTNSEGALYTEADLAAGNVLYQNSVNGATYTASSGPEYIDGNPVPLRPVSAAPANVVYQWITADEAGSDSSADAGEIELLTALPGVSATNEIAAQALDAESPASIEQGAREELGKLSPNGPKDAYNSVAKDVELTGAPGVTKARTFTDSTTGIVTLLLAGPSGAVSSEDVALVEAAVVQWATPGCITPDVSSAINKVINVAGEIWLYDDIGQTSDEVVQTSELGLREFFLARPISGDIIVGFPSGFVFQEGVEAAIKQKFKGYFMNLVLSTPVVDTPITEQEIPVFGTLTSLAVNFEPRNTA